MGRIKTTAIKVLARELIKKYGDRFTDNFEHNKEVLNEVRPMASKRMRNVVAGYITREMKRIKKEGI